MIINQDNVLDIMDWAIDEILSELQINTLYNLCNEKHIYMYSLDGFDLLYNLLDDNQKERLQIDMKNIFNINIIK